MRSRQIKALLMVFVMVVSVLFSTNIALADNSDVYVSYCVANDGNDIEIGAKFELKVVVKNDSSGDISDVVVFVEDNGSFIQVAPGKIDQISKGDDGEAIVSMRYTGGAKRDLKVKLSFNKESGGSVSDKENPIEIKNTLSDDTYDRRDTDTSKYEPVLEFVSGSAPEGKAGGTITIPITIKNISKYEARDVRITPVLTGLPFIVEQMTVSETIEKIPAEKSVTVEFKFKVDKYAQENTYTLPLNFSYKNVYGDSYPKDSSTREVFIKITNTNIPPKLVVREAKTSPAIIKPSEFFIVTFDLWNVGSLEAKNVTVDLAPGNNFFALDNVTRKYIFEQKGLSNTEITYRLKAKDNLETGTYPITVTLDHDDEKGVQYPIYIIVEGEEEQEENVDIVTENIVTPDGAIPTEQPFTVSFDIKNIGTTEAKDIKVTVEPGDKILPQSLNVMTVPGLKPGETVPVSFSFVAMKGAESRSYPIKAVIEYKNGDEIVKKEQYMGVLVEEKKESTLNTVPKIIISEYYSDPGMVKAGENFTLHMSFLNTSKLKEVQNMKITLVVDEKGEETGGSVFTPVESSNTFYIDELGPGESVDKELVMYTIPDAKAKTYVVKAIFEYEYEENGQLKVNNMEDVFGIPVIQPAKLEVTDVIVYEPAFVGEPVYISSEFYNMGRVKLSNLMIRVEGDFDTRESNYFVGNFDIGYSDYYEGSIIPLNPGETKGKLVYTFEDAAGEEHRIEKEFTVVAMESEPVINPFPDGFPGGGMDFYPEMPDEKASKFPVIPVVIGGVVLVGVIVLVIVLKRRKKRKEMMLDEDI